MKRSPWRAALLLAIALSPRAACCADRAASATTEFPGLHWLDWTMVAVYAACILAMGWWYSRRQSSISEYFIGSGAMNSFLIGISLFATMLSTISYLSYPGEMIKHGPVFLAGLLAIPFAYLIVGYAMIPVFMQYRVSSAYQLLEARLGVSVRLLGATLFIVLRAVWMAVLLYMSSKALAVMMGLDDRYLPYIVLATGLITITYASMGGLRAVVVTDCFQFCLLLGGVLLTVALISVKMGGVGWFPNRWAPTWDTQPFFSIDPRVRVTVVGMILMQLTFRVCTAGGDQLAVQRYMATRDAHAARRSYLVNCVANLIVVGALALVGFALLGFYEQNPQYMPAGWDLRESADKLFPHYIANHLPVGISGLVVAAMFAAAMSSIDSGVNSITAVVMNDYLGRFGGATLSETQRVRLAKVAAFGIGAVVVVLGGQVGAVPGNFLEIVQRTTGMFVAPMFGLFFLALFVPSANAFGAVLGTVYGVAAGICVAYWDVLTGFAAISFQYILLVALLTQVVVALAASRFPRANSLPGGRRVEALLWLLPLVAGCLAINYLDAAPGQ